MSLSFLPSYQRLATLAGKAARFSLWQGSSQALQLVTGFLLIRWLGVEDYAQIGLVLSFQNMLTQFSELGISNAIIALVGQRVHDRSVVGAYVAAAWSLRLRLLGGILPIAAVAFGFFAWQHHWPLQRTVLLFGAIATLIMVQGLMSLYAPVLLMQQAVDRFYVPQLLLSVGRLGSSFLLHLTQLLNAVSLSWIQVVTAAISGLLSRRAARPHLLLPASPDPALRREFLRYVSPLIPGMVFYAFQGQLQVFLISIFGQTQQIAEVTALGRISQLFIFASTFFGVVAVPHLARIDRALLRRRYLQFMMLAMAFCGCLIAASLLAPGLFLWLIGPKYQHLSDSLTLSLAATSFSFLTGLLYSFNNARRWVFHWTGIASVGGSLVVQVLLIAILPLHSTRNVMLFSAICAAYPLIPFILTAVIGYRQTIAQPLPVSSAAAPPADHQTP